MEEEEEAETAAGHRPNIKIPLEQQLDRVGCRGRAPPVPRARPAFALVAAEKGDCSVDCKWPREERRELSVPKLTRALSAHRIATAPHAAVSLCGIHYHIGH